MIAPRAESTIRLAPSKRKAPDDPAHPVVKGRPRKEPANVEAVERRRTQLRVAQRAFRKRRETTIDELREQVVSLQQRNDDLLFTLRGFAERAVRKGLSDELSIDLLEILNKYTDPRDADDTESASPPFEDQVSNEDVATKANGSQTRIPPEHISDHIATTMANDYTRAKSQQSNDSACAEMVMTVPPSGQLGVNPVTAARNNTSSVGYAIPRELYPSSTAGFDGTSFANRLRRRIMECAYQTLTNPSRASRVAEEVFEFAIAKGHSLATLAGFVANTLSCDPSQLEALPYGRLGTIADEGPYMNNATYTEQSWLFPPDVESYLARHGIIIDPGTWFVRTKVRREVLQIQGKRQGTWSDPQPRSRASLQPFGGAAHERYRSSEMLQQRLTPLQDMTTSTTPVDNYLQSVDEFNLDTASLFFPVHNMSWVNDDLPRIAHNESNRTMITKDTICSFANGYSALPHNEAYFLQPPSDHPGTFKLYSTNLDDFGAVDSSFDNYNSIHEPSLCTGTTETASTEQNIHDDSPLDVTVDVTELIRNLILSVKCLGFAPRIKKVDIDRALRASVLIHN